MNPADRVPARLADSPSTAAALASNRALWDEWTAIHAGSTFYDVAGFKRGGVRIAPHEIAEIGDVRGLRLLHLQCHFGLDKLSSARLMFSIVATRRG